MQAKSMQSWAGKGVKKFYRLADETAATTLAADGRAVEEGILYADTIVWRTTVGDDSSPWTGNRLGNRPTGIPVKIDGRGPIEIIPADAEVVAVEDTTTPPEA